jgi:glyoxylase-like metal-dependent hydrolase (beta-lactamase superfamily II)
MHSSHDVWRRGTWPLLSGLAWLAACALLVSGCAAPAPGASTVERLYVLYCGEARIPDISPWSPGVNVGQPAVFSDNCYLIHHGQDWMLWDSGFADGLADHPDGVAGARGMRAFRRQTLASQLDEIGVAPAQIKFIAFSHTHADHVGNAKLFPAATWYVQQAEYDAAFGPDPGKYGFVPATYASLRGNPVVKLHGDLDVFGDGSVKILSTPGHTPGHQSLLVRLPSTGAVILSGDVAHFEDNFVNRRVPGFNYDALQSRQSMDRIAAIAAAEHAQIWINHDARQTATIQHAPQFYQ